MILNQPSAPFNAASPPAIGGTTPAAITGTTVTATTGVVIPVGSAGAPSLSFASDSNCGIYSVLADYINFTTAGTQRMRIEDSGNVTFYYNIAVTGIAAAFQFTGTDVGGVTQGTQFATTSNIADSTTLNGGTAGDQDFSVTKTFGAGANYWKSGVPVTIRAIFRYTIDADALAPTINIKLKSGATTIIDFGAIATVASTTNKGIEVMCLLTPRSNAGGAGQTICRQGTISLSTDSILTSGQFTIPNGASDLALAGNGAVTLKFTVEFAGANADVGDTITLESFIIK